MRRHVEPWLRRWWAGDAGIAGVLLSLFAFPAEALYRAVVAARNGAYDRGWLRGHRAAVPVISVGNVTVGGTGKTPVTAWLAGELAARGARPAVVSRGYGDDELQLHRRWNPGVAVHAHPDRVRAAGAAAAAGASVVFLDDGFQHRRLARNLDLVLLAAEHPFPGRLLPRGPYREPAAALARAHAILVTRRTADDERVREVVERAREVVERARSDRGTDPVPIGVAHLVFGGWKALDGTGAEAPVGEVVAATAVAGPESFAALVALQTGQAPELLAFPDHHAFDDADVDRIVRATGPRTLVVTEKDAVKLVRFTAILPPTRVLSLRIEAGPGTKEVLERVRGAGLRPGNATGDGMNVTDGGKGRP